MKRRITHVRPIDSQEEQRAEEEKTGQFYSYKPKPLSRFALMGFYILHGGQRALFTHQGRKTLMKSPFNGEKNNPGRSSKKDRTPRMDSTKQALQID